MQSVEKSSEVRQYMSASLFHNDTLDLLVSNRLIAYSFFWSLCFLAAVPVAAVYSGEGWHVFSNFAILITSPSKLVTDYFNLGSLGSAFLNAALCGLACNIIMLAVKARASTTLLAGYFLVVAHCFYGLNIVNMWPPFLGIVLYSVVRKEKLSDILHLGMFATSLGPFISDFLFRYTLGDAFDVNAPRVTLWGVLLSLAFGALAGFLIPALLPGTTKMHRGHNLYKAGLAIGLFGMFANALFYKTFGITVPDTVVRENPLYNLSGNEYILFADIFFGVVFGVTLLAGFIRNGCSFHGYHKIWNCDGWQDDFPKRFGMPLTLINIGLYGAMILLYFNAAFFFTAGVGFSGPTVGVTIAAITFSAAGQTPRNVWPIAVGYVLLSCVVHLVCGWVDIPVVWTITTQGYINGFAFATGLCPFAGRYGWKIGILAGALHAVLCTSTAAMHGGFVLYNGGLTSGLTAMLLVPVLDFYHVKTVDSKEEA